ncbi:LPS assembly lipoprotein LptE [Idiomarina sp. HP20-50]|uniref:LPS-assembly lipoprotein LptE n=1 Tax=Idiomarina sp. HP20-50 TaxID=3070813 RepID=UPI00294B0973|nr:LPS assembly lipoprotein LptE [Idiomarina sp. HP20-50]MDV6315481.1 LPS assembly lipoprotein LptE [Idiomarina sp. HP20-50]
MRIGLNLILMLTLVATLSGCGFQLRGNYQLPETLQSVSLESYVSKELSEHMKQRFVHSGIKVLDAEEPTVRLISDKLERRTLSLFESGQVAEYELLYQVKYQLVQGNQLLLERTVEVARDYQDDPNFALAKTREREMLVDEMRAEASRRILQQIISEMSEQSP